MPEKIRWARHLRALKILSNVPQGSIEGPIPLSQILAARIGHH